MVFTVLNGKFWRDATLLRHFLGEGIFSGVSKVPGEINWPCQGSQKTLPIKSNGPFFREHAPDSDMTLTSRL